MFKNHRKVASQKSKPRFKTKKKQDLTVMSIILMVLTEILVRYYPSTILS